MSRHIELGAVFVAAVAARLAFHWLTGYTADDAFITFRYAENLATGLGFVYNPGERVLGTTTPLFTLLLAALRLLTVPIPVSALCISLISSGLTAVLLYRFALGLRFGLFAWLPVIAYILWPRSVPVETSGMETALFTLLVTSAFFCQFRLRCNLALVMASLATLTRPEGLILVVILLTHQVFTFWRHALKSCLIVAMVLTPWILFATLYFGSPIPNSMLAKMSYFSQSQEFTVWDTLVYLMAWHNIGGWMMTLLALLGGYWMIRTMKWGWLEIAWMVILLAGYSLGRARIFHWYIAPIYPVYLLFTAAPCCLATRQIRFLQSWTRAFAALIVVLTCAALLWWGYQTTAYFSRVQQAYLDVHYKIGKYLRDAARPDELVAAQDIGYIGYYSTRRIIDRDGLVSPEVFAYNRDGRYFELLSDFSPDWAVIYKGSPISLFTQDEQFRQSYELEASFVADRFTYELYRRRLKVLR